MTQSGPRKTVSSSKASAISRREFARRAAMASAAAAMSPALIVPATELGAGIPGPQQPSAGKPSPSAGQMEYEARVSATFALYGQRLSEDQKKDILRLQKALQPQLEALRAYSLANGDASALHLKPLIEREKPAPAKPATPPKR